MANAIHSGELRNKVVFKQPTSSLNEELGVERTYTTAFETFAKVEKFNQYRTTEANATNLIGSLDFTIRWAEARELVDKDWLIEYKGEDYTIHQVEPIEQRTKFIRFTAKSNGKVVAPLEYEGEVPLDIDRSHLALTFVVSDSLEWLFTIGKTFASESFIDWGDGSDEVAAHGTEINANHTYGPGTFTCKIYPVNGVTLPEAPMVNAIQTISLLKIVGGVALTIGPSLEACEYLRSIEANDFGMPTLPDLPNAGVEQVRSVSVLNSDLDGEELSDLFIQLDEINWPVGYVEVSGNPGAGSLTTAGAAAKQNLINKGWTVNG